MYGDLMASACTGFTLLSMNFLATGQDMIAAFFFVLSLGFKQMALYYAPAIGAYLLAKCLYLGPVKGCVNCLFSFRVNRCFHQGSSIRQSCSSDFINIHVTVFTLVTTVR